MARNSTPPTFHNRVRPSRRQVNVSSGLPVLRLNDHWTCILPSCIGYCKVKGKTILGGRGEDRRCNMDFWRIERGSVIAKRISKEDCRKSTANKGRGRGRGIKGILQSFKGNQVNFTLTQPKSSEPHPPGNKQ